jgi:hypothetical protein
MYPTCTSLPLSDVSRPNVDICLDDFAAPAVDSIEGVTHALRSNEYRDRNVLYQWVQDALGLRKVEIWDFAFVFILLNLGYNPDFTDLRAFDMT